VSTKTELNALVLATNAGTSEGAVTAIKSQFLGAEVVSCESLEAAVACLAESRQPFSVVCLGTREFLATAGDGRSYLRILREALEARGWLGKTEFYFFSTFKRELHAVEGH